MSFLVVIKIFWQEQPFLCLTHWFIFKFNFSQILRIGVERNQIFFWNIIWMTHIQVPDRFFVLFWNFMICVHCLFLQYSCPPCTHQNGPVSSASSMLGSIARSYRLFYILAIKPFKSLRFTWSDLSQWRCHFSVSFQKGFVDLSVYIPVCVCVCMLTLTYVCTWGWWSEESSPACLELGLHMCVTMLFSL